MKTFSFPKILAGVTCMLLLLAACQKKADKAEKAARLAANDVQILACTVKDTVVRGTGTDFYKYSSWDSIRVAIGPTLKLRFEGPSNSFVRPTSPGWFIGTSPLADSCDTWSAIAGTITQKNNSLGTWPDTLTPTYAKYNVVGINGSFLGKSYGLGYYAYNSTTHVPSISSTIVAWKDASATWPSGTTSVLADLTPEAYVISIHRIGLGLVSGTYRDTIWYSYKKI